MGRFEYFLEFNLTLNCQDFHCYWTEVRVSHKQAWVTTLLGVGTSGSRTIKRLNFKDISSSAVNVLIIVSKE